MTNRESREQLEDRTAIYAVDVFKFFFWGGGGL